MQLMPGTAIARFSVTNIYNPETGEAGVKYMR